MGEVTNTHTEVGNISRTYERAQAEGKKVVYICSLCQDRSPLAVWHAKKRGEDESYIAVHGFSEYRDAFDRGSGSDARRSDMLKNLKIESQKTIYRIFREPYDIVVNTRKGKMTVPEWFYQFLIESGVSPHDIEFTTSEEMLKEAFNLGSTNVGDASRRMGSRF